MRPGQRLNLIFIRINQRCQFVKRKSNISANSSLMIFLRRLSRELTPLTV
jgi:hypothetical protein